MRINKALQVAYQNKLSRIRPVKIKPLTISIGGLSMIIKQERMDKLIKQGIVFRECSGHKKQGIITKCGKVQLYDNPIKGLWFNQEQKDLIIRHFQVPEHTTSHGICQECMDRLLK